MLPFRPQHGRVCSYIQYQRMYGAVPASISALTAMTSLYACRPMRAAHPLHRPDRRYLGGNDFDGPFPSGILSMTKLVQLCASLRCLA